VAIWVAWQRPAIDQRLDGVRRAADDMSAAIGALRTVAWQAKRAPADPTAVQDAVYAVELVCRTHDMRLPPGMGHLRRSVREAATNYFGGPSGYGLTPLAQDWPIDNHNEYFWELAVGYFDLTINTIGRWRDHPRRRDHTLQMYHLYRREDDAYFHQANDRLARAFSGDD
jgi:hypothetical protein